MLLGKTVGELERGLAARELAEWIAYFEAIEPLPDPTRDAAKICWVIACANHARGPAPRLEDFMPRPPAAGGRGQTTEEMMAAFGRATGG